MGLGQSLVMKMLKCHLGMSCYRINMDVSFYSQVCVSSLNFSSFSLVIRVNLHHPQPSSVLLGLLSPL